MCDGIYLVHLQDNNAYNSLSLTTEIKRSVMNEESSLLWHRRLGHVSIKRIIRLVNEGVLNALDFTDSETCLDYIKGKQTRKSKKGATRRKHLLDIIHINICCPDMDGSDLKYFITFIDDYSRYMYLYMLRPKDEGLDSFKVFKVEVKKQCEKKIKIVRLNRGGEYYGMYIENGQTPGPFARFLQEHGMLPNTPCLVLRTKMVWWKE